MALLGKCVFPIFVVLKTKHQNITSPYTQNLYSQFTCGSRCLLRPCFALTHFALALQEPQILELFGTTFMAFVCFPLLSLSLSIHFLFSLVPNLEPASLNTALGWYRAVALHICDLWLLDSFITFKTRRIFTILTLTFCGPSSGSAKEHMLFSCAFPADSESQTQRADFRCFPLFINWISDFACPFRGTPTQVVRFSVLALSDRAQTAKHGTFARIVWSVLGEGHN